MTAWHAVFLAVVPQWGAALLPVRGVGAARKREEKQEAETTDLTMRPSGHLPALFCNLSLESLEAHLPVLALHPA